MELILSIGTKIIEFFGANEKAGMVFAYIVGVWAIVTAVKYIAGWIVKLTPSTNDDAWFAKVVSFIDTWIAPIIKIFPHSTFQFGKVFTAIVNGATWIISFFTKEKK